MTKSRKAKTPAVTVREPGPLETLYRAATFTPEQWKQFADEVPLTVQQIVDALQTAGLAGRARAFL